MKTFAATLSVPAEVKRGEPIPITGYAQVGISGLSKIQVWVHPSSAVWPADDPYFTKAAWTDARILPPPKHSITLARLLPSSASSFYRRVSRFDGSGQEVMAVDSPGIVSRFKVFCSATPTWRDLAGRYTHTAMNGWAIMPPNYPLNRGWATSASVCTHDPAMVRSGRPTRACTFCTLLSSRPPGPLR